jgi:hypothetical protein
MPKPLPVCRHHVEGAACPQSQTVLLDERPTHLTVGCLTCGGVTIVTRSDFNRHCLEQGIEQQGLELRRATEREKAWFVIHRR